MPRIVIIFFFPLLIGLIDPPNYNFDLKILDQFQPENSISEIDKIYPKARILGKEIKRYLINYQRFLFPIFVRFENNRVTDFFATLPSYFLHDVFHQSLINKLGQQNKYFKKENSAIYIWNKDDYEHIYSARCTITCFPLYYAVYKSKGKGKNLLNIFMSQY